MCALGYISLHGNVYVADPVLDPMRVWLVPYRSISDVDEWLWRLDIDVRDRTGSVTLLSVCLRASSAAQSVLAYCYHGAMYVVIWMG